jgi:hypothetical protein
MQTAGDRQTRPAAVLVSVLLVVLAKLAQSALFHGLAALAT